MSARRHSPDSTPNPTDRRTRILYWLLALVSLGLLGWVWWLGATYGPSPEGGGRKPEVGDQTPETGEQKPEAGSQKPEAVPPRAATAGQRAEIAGRRSEAIAHRGPASNRLASVMAEYASLKAAPASPPTNPPQPAATSSVPETAVPPGAVDEFPRPVRDLFEAQLALDRLGISPGSLDGQIGPQTRAALRAFQEQQGLSPSGELDPATRDQLCLATPPLTTYIVTAQDLARLQPLSPTWLGKSQQTALDYETILELAAEKGHAHPALIRRLNPGLDWAAVAAGAVVQIPEATRPALSNKAAFVTIRLGDKVLEAFDAGSRLVAHFPCSIAQRVEKRPVGALHVAVIAPNPNYTFDPGLFPESAEAQRLKAKLLVPPGPNNPVGAVWIGLDKPGYGIHGTPNPEQVGRTESHGCFRLANWNAEFLANMVWVGMPVYVER